MPARLRKHIFGAAVGALSMGGLLPALSLLRTPPEEGGTEAGWQQLSLPVELGIQGEPFVGWDELSARRMTDDRVDVVASPIDSESPASSATKPEGEPRLQFFGRVVQRSQKMYCFFDTKISRWIWLRPGETDNESRVRLIENRIGVFLEDELAGMKYRIESDLVGILSAAPGPEAVAEN